MNELKVGDEILSVNGADVTQLSSEVVQGDLDQAVKVGVIELRIRRHIGTYWT